MSLRLKKIPICGESLFDLTTHQDSNLCIDNRHIWQADFSS